MKISDIVSFINPFSDALSAFFVLTLISLSVLTVIWLFISAKATNWERNWHGNDTSQNSGLESDHGSVQELSETVATKAEQVADIMPSMLLIIGLLGTFIGLGIALNSASEVLANANTAGMDSAMTGLMSLMEGLGAKFKTSTWGILCFIILNVLFNVMGYKEKRLAWAIQKVRQESEQKTKQQEAQHIKRHDDIVELLNFIAQTSQESNQALIASNSVLEKSNQENLVELRKIASYNKSTQDAMQDFVKSTVTSMSSIGESADQMAKAARAVGDSANDLNAVVDKLQSELKGVMDMIRRDLGDTITKMGNNFEESMGQMANSMSQATQGISTAVTSLSNSVNSTMDRVQSIIGESMDLQRKSAQEFTVTSTTLNGQIVEMTNLVQQLSGDITSGLKAVSESGRRMQSLDKKFATNADQVEAITTANQSLAQTLEELADKTYLTNNQIHSCLNNLDISIKKVSEDISSSLQQLQPKQTLLGA